jgi:hypothetical protein
MGEGLSYKMQMSLDGFVESLDGDPVMPVTADPGLEGVMFEEIVNTCDPILLGHQMTDGFVKYFSRTVRHAEGKNLSVESGPLVDAVDAP